MDLVLLIGVATALLVIIITLYFAQRRNQSKPAEQAPRAAVQRGVPVRATEGVPRRAQIARNQRNRLRQNNEAEANVAAAAAQEQAVDNDGDEANSRVPAGAKLDEKWGAKKRAKEEAKEQKRIQREQELKEREERKIKEAKLDEERKREEELLEEQEKKKLEKERLETEERLRKEHEEYLKMKEAFSIDEEGFEEDVSEEGNMLASFVQYIKDNKVVVLEDLAIEFKLKTQQAIERIQDLQSNGTLTGVIDDRGKFIYISEEELAAVAKFIRQRGRVSIAELAESSNNLINLTPVTTG